MPGSECVSTRSVQLGVRAVPPKPGAWVGEAVAVAPLSAEKVRERERAEKRLGLAGTKVE